MQQKTQNNVKDTVFNGLSAEYRSGSPDSRAEAQRQ
jgi:hypothetical protein